MSEQNKKVVVDFIQAINRADGAGAAKCLAPDVQAVIKNTCKIAASRSYDQIVNSIDAFKKLMPAGLKPTILTVLAEDNRVVVEFEGNAILANGTPYSNEYAMVFTVEGGKIKRVHEYFCSKLVDEAVWPLVAGTAF